MILKCQFYRKNIAYLDNQAFEIIHNLTWIYFYSIFISTLMAQQNYFSSLRLKAI